MVKDGNGSMKDDDVFLSAEEILALDDLQVTKTWIPEWNTNVRLRVMAADVALKFQDQLADPAKKKDAWVKIFALCAVNEDGSRMFTDQMLEKLRKKSTKVFMRLQDELLRINGFSKEQGDALKNDSSGADPDASRIV